MTTSEQLDATAEVLMKLSNKLFETLNNFEKPSLETLHKYIYNKAQCKLIDPNTTSAPINIKSLTCARHLDIRIYPNPCTLSLYVAQELQNVINNLTLCNASKFKCKSPMRSLHEHAVIVTPTEDLIVRPDNMQYMKCLNTRNKQRVNNILQYAQQLSSDMKSTVTDTPKVMIKSLSANNTAKWEEVYSVTKHFFITFSTVCIQICLQLCEIKFIHFI